MAGAAQNYIAVLNTFVSPEDVILQERPHARVLDRSEVIALGSGARLLVRPSGAGGGT